MEETGARCGCRVWWCKCGGKGGCCVQSSGPNHPDPRPVSSSSLSWSLSLSLILLSVLEERDVLLLFAAAREADSVSVTRDRPPSADDVNVVTESGANKLHMLSVSRKTWENITSKRIIRVLEMLSVGSGEK